jgi:hypothetical protein
MGMVMLWSLFPELAERETRTVWLPAGNPLPSDTYALVELYCVDPGCDCRRVMVNVLSERGGRHEATVNHAFDPDNDEGGLGQTFLDPLNPQGKNAALVLRLFVESLDPTYEARLERHYRLVKDALRDPRHPVHARLPRSSSTGAPARRAKRRRRR